MFPGGSGSSGGGMERQQAARGTAHPYLDSVSPSTGPPLFPSYAGRPAGSHSNDDAAVDRDDSNDVFREEDRMLLRLLYHQQQAIQVQLNTMTEWMQQVSYRIANVERVVRASRGTAPTTSSAVASPFSGPARSHTAQPASRSASAMEGYAPMSSPQLASQPRPTAHNTHPTSAEQPSAEVPPAHFSAADSTHGGQSPQMSSALAVSSVLEGSRACTPPSEQTRHHAGGAASSSAVPSTTRSYESALAAPWDPHSAGQQQQQSFSSAAAVHSRSSSHTSALGRRANPLLNSSATRTMAQLPVAASRSSLQDSRQHLSRLDTSVLSGTGQTSSASVIGAAHDAAAPQGQPRQPPVVSPPTTAAQPYADAAVPPYRRIPTETTTTTLPRQPLSRLSAASRHAPPSSALADVAEGRGGGREGTLPPPPHSTGTSSLHDHSEIHHDGGNAPNQPSGSGQGYKEAARATASSAPAAMPPPVHADPTHNVNAEDSAPARKGGLRRFAADDDSLSDGYGSYESRMYMKNLGLL